MSTPPLPWRPSFITIVLLMWIPLGAWLHIYFHFFYSSSTYMHEITHSDKPIYRELRVPPIEQAEAEAASVGANVLTFGTDWAEWVFVPLMQRFMWLLFGSWVIHLFILEPILLSIHLMMGEPTRDDFAKFVLKQLPKGDFRQGYEKLLDNIKSKQGNRSAVAQATEPDEGPESPKTVASVGNQREAMELKEEDEEEENDENASERDAAQKEKVRAKALERARQKVAADIASDKPSTPPKVLGANKKAA